MHDIGIFPAEHAYKGLPPSYGYSGIAAYMSTDEEPCDIGDGIIAEVGEDETHALLHEEVLHGRITLRMGEDTGKEEEQRNHPKVDDATPWIRHMSMKQHDANDTDTLCIINPFNALMLFHMAAKVQ